MPIPASSLTTSTACMRAQHAGDRAQHAALRAGGQGVLAGVAVEQAAQAGVGAAEMGLVGGELAVEPLHRGAHQGPAQGAAGIVDREPGRQIVAAVGDEIVARDELARIGGLERGSGGRPPRPAG